MTRSSSIQVASADVSAITHIRQLLQAAKLATAEDQLMPLLAQEPPTVEALELWLLLCQCKADEAGLQALATRTRGLNPESHPQPEGLGSLLLRLGLTDESIRAYQAALTRGPESASLWLNLGRATLAQGDIDNTLEAFTRAQELAPDELRLKVAQQLLLPLVYRSAMEIEAWRRRFRFGLEQLAQSAEQNPPLLDALFPILTGRSNFFLGFQAQDDKALQMRYGSLLQTVVGRRVTALPASRPRRERIRIAYISTYFNGHTVGRLAEGLVKYHDRDRFEVYVYHLGEKRDNITDSFERHATHFEHLGPQLSTGPLSDPLALLAHLRRAEPDIAAFADLGMEPLGMTLAAARVAPVQCTFWYHPITSGIPSVDYFISSGPMEPEDGLQHYSETLVSLPGIASCYPRPMLPTAMPRRENFGLPADAVVYLSPQFLYKYLPQYDVLFPRIAKRVPNACFAFIGHHSSPHLTRRLLLRLAQAFAREGLNFTERCVVVPQLNGEQYLQLNRVSDVLLDTVGWSGGRTTLEGMACGLPVVTLPGAFMRGRHTFAMLKLLDLPELIAGDEAQYVDIAVRLGTDKTWRAQLLERLQAGLDTQIFGRQDVVTALERAYAQWVR